MSQLCQPGEKCSATFGCPDHSSPEPPSPRPSPSALFEAAGSQMEPVPSERLCSSQCPWLSALTQSLAAREGTGMPATSQLAAGELVPSGEREEGVSF